MGNSNYRCQTTNMRNCVETLLKWINSAMEMSSIIKDISAEEYLSGELVGWYITIDGQKCGLGDALDILWEKAAANLDAAQSNPIFVDAENQIAEREQYLNEACSAYQDGNYICIIRALNGFLGA